MVGGSSIVLFILRSLWENCYAILRQYHYYVVGYLVASSIISFGVCYRFGPLTDTRSLHLLQWALQAIGLILIFVSSEYKEAVVGIIIVLLCVHNFPRSWINQLTGLW
jgi:NEMP family